MCHIWCPECGPHHLLAMKENGPTIWSSDVGHPISDVWLVFEPRHHYYVELVGCVAALLFCFVDTTV